MRKLLAFPLVLVLACAAHASSLFVIGQESRAVLEYDAATGAFTRVFAATVASGFRNPGGIALRPGDGTLYVSSRATGAIWRYTTATGALQTPAVATGLVAPNGLDFSTSGAFLYFADAKDDTSASDDAVKRIEIATGAITTLGSTANAEFADVAVNGSDVFAVDTDGSRIVRFPAAGGAGTAVIASGLSHPSDLAFRSSTRLLVADTGTDRVLEYLLSGGSWVFDRVVLAASAGVADPCALAIAPNGALTVTGCLSNDAVSVDLATLAVSPLVAPGAAGLASPKDAVWNGATLLLANPVANAIVYYDASGAPTGVRAQGVTASLDGGIALSADESRLAIASMGDDAVIEYAADTGIAVRRSNGACAGLFPSDVAYGPSGDLFVACFGANSVNRIAAASGAVSSFVLGGTGGLLAPRSLGFAANGHLLVSSASGEVLEYDASGGFVRAFVDAAGNGGGPIDPYGFAFHGNALYVTSSFTDEVKAYDAATGAYLATLVASGSGGLDAPSALAFGPANDVFVASAANDSVRRYHAATGAFLGVPVASGANGLDAPIDVVVRGLPEAPARIALLAATLLLARLARARRSR